MNSSLTRSHHSARLNSSQSHEPLAVRVCPIVRHAWLAALLFACVTTASPNLYAQTGTLAVPFPQPDPNAALHYQQALLHLSKVPADQQQLLTSPVWDSRQSSDAQSLRKLLVSSRYAVSAATAGTRLSECNFGTDFSSFGAASQLPHVQGMVQLGRLLSLRGYEAESRGQWEEALIIYFDGLRMGRHLTHQNTLLETLSGIEILRNQYYCLASWATRCPERLLVARAFGLLESIQVSLVDAPQSVACEASILALDFRRLRESYPDGDWAQWTLQSYQLPITGEKERDRQAAINACVARGVPKEAFASDAAFRAYITQLERTSNRFIESVAACMALNPKARLRRAAAIRKKYSVVIPILSTEALIDPVEIGVWFSHHEADLTLTRLSLALASSRAKDKFPANLDSVSKRFGGSVPVNPYTGESVQYSSREDASAFSLAIPGAGPLPAVSFDSQPPIPAKEASVKAAAKTPEPNASENDATGQGANSK